MSDWKKIGKSSYNLSVGKFAEWAPSHPFTIPYQGPKIHYSEGDEITDVTDPGFNIDFTGRPLSAQHFPCGYWHKNYIPPQQTIYTSCLYPVEFNDAIVGISSILVSGYFNARIDHYVNITDNVIGNSLSLYSGNFRKMVLYGYDTSKILSTNLTLLSGVFRQVVHSYSLNESVMSESTSIISGIFRDVVINYDYWIPAKIQDLGISIVGGSHGN